VIRDADVWKYFETILLPELYPTPWYQQELDPDYQNDTGISDFPGNLYLNDLNSKLLTGARIRQLRSDKGEIFYCYSHWL